MQYREIDFCELDYSRLSPAQKELVKRQAMQRAKACREEALRAGFAGLWAWARRIGTRLVTWRRRRAAISELSGFDDEALKDIGIYRSEIVSIVELGTADTTRWSAPPTRSAA
jgi:uncharacterized protein YjiS (DUF1127 family)